MAIVLRVRQLTVARGERMLFAPLNFELIAGETLHVEGRNGAGKTSLLEALASLRAAAAGAVEPATHAAHHWLGHRNGLHPLLSPIENLRFWSGLNEVRADPLPALQRVGIAALRHRPCGRLSTGQKRRAALARLLVVRRPLWLLDEPLAGLDTAGQRLLVELLSEHAASGGATVLTSHQPLPASLPGLRTLQLS
jgi:heme exporter protein A